MSSTTTKHLTQIQNDLVQTNQELGLIVTKGSIDSTASTNDHLSTLLSKYKKIESSVSSLVAVLHEKLNSNTSKTEKTLLKDVNLDDTAIDTLLDEIDNESKTNINDKNKNKSNMKVEALENQLAS